MSCTGGRLYHWMLGTNLQTAADQLDGMKGMTMILNEETLAITEPDNENSTGNEMGKKKQLQNACYSNMVTSNRHNTTECEIATGTHSHAHVHNALSHIVTIWRMCVFAMYLSHISSHSFKCSIHPHRPDCDSVCCGGLGLCHANTHFNMRMVGYLGKIVLACLTLWCCWCRLLPPSSSSSSPSAFCYIGCAFVHTVNWLQRSWSHANPFQWFATFTIASYHFWKPNLIISDIKLNYVYGFNFGLRYTYTVDPKLTAMHPRIPQNRKRNCQMGQTQTEHTHAHTHTKRQLAFK